MSVITIVHVQWLWYNNKTCENKATHICYLEFLKKFKQNIHIRHHYGSRSSLESLPLGYDG